MNAPRGVLRGRAELLALLLMLAPVAGCGGKGDDGGSAKVNPKAGSRRREMEEFQKNNKTTAVEATRPIRNHP